MKLSWLIIRPKTLTAVLEYIWLTDKKQKVRACVSDNFNYDCKGAFRPEESRDPLTAGGSYCRDDAVGKTDIRMCSLVVLTYTRMTVTLFCVPMLSNIGATVDRES